MEIKDGDWIEYRRLVLDNMERLERDQKAINEKIDREVKVLNEKLDSIKTELSVLKTKSAVWGGLVAAIVTPVAVALILNLVNLK